MSKNRKPRQNPNPQPNVATAQQFLAAMQYATAHEATINAMYRDRQDRSNQCFVLIDHDNRNNAALLGTLTAGDPDGVNRYVAACRADGVRPWILVLVPDASVKALMSIEATQLRSGLAARPNIVPVIALSLPACQVFGWFPEVTEARPQPTPSVN